MKYRIIKCAGKYFLIYGYFIRFRKIHNRKLAIRCVTYHGNFKTGHPAFPLELIDKRICPGSHVIAVGPGKSKEHKHHHSCGRKENPPSRQCRCRARCGAGCGERKENNESERIFHKILLFFILRPEYCRSSFFPYQQI